MAITTVSAEQEKIPKHISLARTIRRQIESGDLKPGDRLPSYNEAKALYGAHTVTLERAHSVLESEGLIVRERGRGTFVAPPSTGKAKPAILGVAGVQLEAQGYYWSQILAGIREGATEAGLQVLLLDLKNPAGWDRADAYIVCNWELRSAADLYDSGLIAPGTPCASVMVPVEGMASVSADDYAGGLAATEHLVSLGHRRIAYLRGKDRNVVSKRMNGWREALAKVGVTPEEDWIGEMGEPHDDAAGFLVSAQLSMTSWIKTGWKESGCTALLCQNDYTALGAIKAFQEAGIRVPEDVSVVGFDGVEVCAFSDPGLTTVEIPLHKIGSRVFEALLEQIQGKEPPTLQTLPVRLRTRRSSGPAPA